jgi:microcystin-dependent protein
MATYEAKKYATIPIAATQVADGSVTNSEYQFINTVSANVQTQLDAKLAAAGAFTIATGMILPWAAPLASKPTGYQNCDGGTISRSTYSALFAIIGTTYGAGDGSSTFALPNFQNRMAIGKSGTYALGSTGGSTTDSFTPSGSVSVSIANHTLTLAQIPSHSHFSSNSGNGFPNLVQNNSALTMTSKSNGGLGNNDYQLVGVSAQANQSPTSNSGSGSSHGHSGSSGSFTGNAGTIDVLNPYISINYIIKE